MKDVQDIKKELDGLCLQTLIMLRDALVVGYITKDIPESVKQNLSILDEILADVLDKHFNKGIEK
ncbi:MAG: hypothetical protein J6T10_13635 [Methanobrevibacter sp.]|nr:hypothetical protein [Methanobrevibacter sp.]